MHDVYDLQTVAKTRLEDARVLVAAGRFAGASYLAGYAVEAALKARICLTLGWLGFPETRREFEGYQSLRTHNLEVLLRFAGVEAAVKAGNLPQWAVVLNWDPAARYAVAMTTEWEASNMVTAVTALVGVL